jgi:CPA2 family monovalent cation:H+ antiporter-2
MQGLAAALAGESGTTDFVAHLAIILSVAALTTVVFQRLRQPVVLGYLLAGLIVGPHLRVPLFVDEQLAHTLSELGVILLMFSLGLEFSLRKLIKVAPTAGVIAIVECSLQIFAGYAVAHAFGWTNYDALFLGAMVAISSTTIIVKAFAEQQVGGRLAELVFGVLIVEDLIAVLLLALLTAIASGAQMSSGALALTVAKLAGFLIVVLGLGMLLVPRLTRAVMRLGRAETTVVAMIGLCFGFALLARSVGYSVALGAFLGGTLVGESGAGEAIAELIAPVRDMFVAIFFVSVGMLIDPKVIVAHWGVVLVLAAVVTVGKVVGVTAGAFLTGNGITTSVRAGMSFAQIGEFSFIIAGVGLSLGAIDGFLYPEAIAVSAITTFTTPWLIRAAVPLAAYLDRRLPKPIQTYAALYGAWIGRLGLVRTRRSAWARVRRLALLLFVDVTAIGVVTIGAAHVHPFLDRAATRLGWHVAPHIARLLLIGAALVLITPFALGAVRLARSLGARLALEAFPAEGGVDLSAAPRRALVVTIQIAILLVAGLPLMAATAPFLPFASGPALLIAGIALLIVPLWRSATNLQEHVRAGAQVVLERLAAQGKQPTPDARAADAAAERVLAGIGAAIPVRLSDASPAVGQTLKALELRGRTSATVVAIERAGSGVIYPTGDEPLRAGDVLVLTGSPDAVGAAEAFLRGGAPGASA